MSFLNDRRGEFARACVEKNLAGDGFTINYCGVVRRNFADLQAVLQSKCYEAWDVSPEAPPKQRPQNTTAAVEQPSLQVLAFNPRRNIPIWPDALATRLGDGPEMAALNQLRSDFEKEFGSPAADSSGASSVSVGRVSGQCDFTIHDGKQPLDFNRCIDPAYVAIATAPSER